MVVSGFRPISSAFLSIELLYETPYAVVAVTVLRSLAAVRR